MANVAAYAMVLARHSGVERVIFGSSVARLDLKADPEMIGYFLDNIYLPVFVRPRDTVADLVRQVRGSVLTAQQNIVPFLQLAEAINPTFAKDRPWPPIFLYDSWVRGRLFESVDDGSTSTFGDLRLSLFPLSPTGLRLIEHPRHVMAYSRYYLPSLYLNDAVGSTGYIEFNSMVFHASTARRIVAQQQSFVARLDCVHSRIGDVWKELSPP